MSLSGSAVDLLSCGLAAAAVLWILVLPNSGKTGTGEVERVNGMLRLSQFGNPHIHQNTKITVQIDGIDHKYKVNSFPLLKKDTATSASPRDQIVQGDAKVILKVSENKSAGFAAETAIIFQNVKPGTKVVLTIYSCVESAAPHAIKLLSGDRRGVTTEVVFWQEEARLKNSLDPSHSSKNWFKNFADLLQTDSNYFSQSSSATRMLAWDGQTSTKYLSLEITATESGLIKTTALKTTSSGSTSFVSIPNWPSKLKDWCEKHNSTGGTC